MTPGARTFVSISLAAHLLAGALVYRHARPAPSDLENGRRPSEAALAGDTFEVPTTVGENPGEDVPGDALDHAAARTPPAPSPGEGEGRAATERSTPRATSRPTSRGAVGSRGGETGGGEATVGTAFGATGERASVDLATAFTRGFPQAASADPVWTSAPYGDAGEAVVVLQISDSGELVSSRIEGSPSSAFRSGLLRTLALIRPRAFTASHPITRLRVAARVSPDLVHDGLHGEVFAIGGSFEALQGSAFFALSIGRRIDVRVTESR
jgi:hypothetical protein